MYQSSSDCAVSFGRNIVVKVSDGVLLPHDNDSVCKCNIIQIAILKVGFIELNDPAYSSNIGLSDHYLFSNLNKFLHDKSFSLDDETINTIEGYLNKNLD